MKNKTGTNKNATFLALDIKIENIPFSVLMSRSKNDKRDKFPFFLLRISHFASIKRF